MTETYAERRKRLLATENTHGPLPPVAMADAVAIAHLAPTKVDDAFGVKLAFPSKWSAPRGMVPTSVVIHCTAAVNPASSTAAFFASPSPSGSTQAVADDIEGYTMVPDDAVCAGAPPFNQEGLHIEQPGLESWSRATWLSHPDQLARVAYHVAGWCKKYAIPVVLLHTADLLRLGEKAHGITYHAAISNAFHQSTHQDPGPGFPWDVFMPLVAQYVKGDDVALTDKQAAALEFIATNEGGLSNLIAVAQGLTLAVDPARKNAGAAASDGVKAGFRAGRELKVQDQGGHGA